MPDVPPESAMRIDVAGEKDGRPATLSLYGTGTMRDATGIALSIGAQLLAAKKLTVEQGGVYGPEGCFNPEDFLRMMGGRGAGEAIGLAQRYDQDGRNKPDPSLPVKRLYVVGIDAGGMGIGTERAADSALNVFDRIVADFQRSG